MTEPTRFPPGKIPWDVVAARVSGVLPPEVRLGPACGEDAALVEMGGQLWAVASDPITFTTHDVGRLAVLVNANDVAVRGARPLFFTAVVLIAPHEAEPARVECVLEEIQRTCSSLGVTLVGGHTEVTPDLPRTVVVGTMFGPVRGRAITTGGLCEGDRIGLTRFAGLEGTAILLAELGERGRAVCGERAAAEADRHLERDWISVLPEAEIAALNPGVSALHDVTEGGVGEALHEMARASGRSIQTSREVVPVLEATRRLAAALDLDPLGLIGSGALLVGCAEEHADELEAAFSRADRPFSWIGRVGARHGDPRTDLPRFARDEILKASRLHGVSAFLFDMDGTLVDSTYDWPAIRQALGIQGHSILDELEALPSPEREEKKALLDQFERDATQKARLKDGARELVEFLRNRGFRTALVTNNSEANAELLLERFDLVFDVVLTRDSGLYKPSPDPLVEAMQRLGVTPEQCVHVGDYLFDLEAGRQAGVKHVGLLYDHEDRFRHLADFSFPDVSAFRTYLELVLPARAPSV